MSASPSLIGRRHRAPGPTTRIRTRSARCGDVEGDDGPARLIGAALELWVCDAAAWVTDSDRLVGELAERCRTAYELLMARPAGSPLVYLAASLSGLAEGGVGLA